MDTVKQQFETLKRYRRLCVGCLIGSLVIGLGLQPHINKLPPVSPAMNEVNYLPAQIPVEPQLYAVVAGKKEFMFQTHFLYEQVGMVVSSNNKTVLSALFPWLRFRDTLNVNDLCLIWGHNVSTGIYQDMTFNQGAYTCFAKAKNNEVAPRVHANFRTDHIGHNHILTNDRALKQKLRDIRAGDLIRLSGFLSSYYYKGQLIRRSSFARTDDDCETIFLTDLKVLKTHRPVMRTLTKTAGIILPLSMALLIYLNIRINRLRHRLVDWSGHARY